MGLINWLKSKELKGLRRRQSAPPVVFGYPDFDADATRTEEYIRALEKFNEWRDQNSKGAAGGCGPISEQQEEKNEQEVTVELEKGEVVVKRIPSKGKADDRFSLPAGPSTRSPKSVQKRNRKCSRNNSINKETLYEIKPCPDEDEIRKFEEGHCELNVSTTELNNSLPLISPPKRFYKKNSQPYAEKMYSKTPTLDDSPKKNQDRSHTQIYNDGNDTPQRRNNAPVKPIRRKKLDKNRQNFDPNGPLPKIKNNNVKKVQEIDSDQFNGSYKHYEVNSSSIYDEYVISSKAYKGQLNASLQESRTCDKNQSAKNSSMTNQRHTYQTVVNKHGDAVEYALPMAEVGKAKQPTLSEELMAIPSPEIPKDSFIVDLDKYDPIIDENFKFLTEKYSLDFSNSMIVNNIKDAVSELDKSAELDKSLRKELNSQREILNELDTLGKWSESIDVSREKVENEDSFNLNDFLYRNESMTVTFPNDVQPRTTILRSTIPTPLEIGGGMFRSAFVSVRKPTFGPNKNVKFAQLALQQDFEITSRVHHSDLAILMAVVADRGVNQMQLVMEPFDYTLNYHIHQQGNEISVLDSIDIVQQIASATSYLQESGIIHSNISSHSILMRRRSVAVKLAFFELATDVNSKLRHEIEAKYGDLVQEPFSKDIVFDSMPDYALLLRGNDKYVKEKYKKLSKNMIFSKVNQTKGKSECNLEVKRQHMPYYLDYRNQYSLYYYQAPELISKKSKFVFPNIFSDVYSLCLLLWELLNNCIPFVIYSYSELEKLYSAKQIELPRMSTFKSKRFEMIFKIGLEKDPIDRILSVQDLISILEDIKFDLNKDNEKPHQDKPRETRETNRPPKTRVNEIITTKSATKEKFVFTDNHLYENVEKTDSQNRLGNAIMNNISLETFDGKSSTNCSQQENSREEEIVRREKKGFQRTNGELSGGLGRMFTPKSRRYEKERKNSIKKRPSPKLSKKSVDNLFNLSQSTIFNSNADLVKAFKGSNDAIYERTSTLKKKKKEPKITAEAAFENPPKSRCNLEDQLNQIDSNLNCNKDEFKSEVQNGEYLIEENKEFDEKSTPITGVSKPSNPNRGLVARARAKFMTNFISETDIKQNKENLSKTMNGMYTTPNNRIIPFKIKSNPNSAPASYKFSIDDFSLPVTPIARNNKLRKNAWLSDNKILESQKELDYEPNQSSGDILNNSFTVETEVAEELKNKNMFSIEKVYNNPNSSTCNISMDDSFKQKKVNVSLKIIHNNKEIFNNSLNTEEDELCQKIQQIHLGMYETGEPGSNPIKPEIKIKMTPSKNGVVVNDLADGNFQLGEKVTNLVSDLRQCFKETKYEALGTDFQNRIVKDLDDLKEIPVRKFEVEVKTLETPKLIKRQIERKGRKEEQQRAQDISKSFSEELAEKQKNVSNVERFENSLWHKEKSICERTSASLDNLDETQTDWISVQEAIKRIESISKSMTESPKTFNKSHINTAEKSIVNLSRIPNAGGLEEEDEKDLKENCLNNIVLQANSFPIAASSPLSAEEARSRSCNTSLRPNQLIPGPSRFVPKCCSDTNLVRRSSTFNESKRNFIPNRNEKPRRITTKVTLNLRKVQQMTNDGPRVQMESIPSNEDDDRCHLVCRNCGTEMAQDKENSTAYLSTSMIAYPKDLERVAREPLSRRSSSCSTLLRLNQDDMYIDDDFEDSSLAPNIKLVKDEEYAIDFDQN